MNNNIVNIFANMVITKAYPEAIAMIQGMESFSQQFTQGIVSALDSVIQLDDKPISFDVDLSEMLEEFLINIRAQIYADKKEALAEYNYIVTDEFISKAEALAAEVHQAVPKLPPLSTDLDIKQLFIFSQLLEQKKKCPASLTELAQLFEVLFIEMTRVTAKKEQEKKTKQAKLKQEKDEKIKSLQKAITDKNVEQIKALLADGLPIDVKLDNNISAMEYACQIGTAEVAAEFIRYGSIDSNISLNNVKLALKQENFSLFKLLADNSASQTKKQEWMSLTYQYAPFSLEEDVFKLLRDYADPEYFDELIAAALKHDVGHVLEFVFKQKESIVYQCSFSGGYLSASNTQCVDILIKHFKQIDFNDDCMYVIEFIDLLSQCKQVSMAEVIELIHYNIHSKQWNGDSLISFAIKYAPVEQLAQLLAHPRVDVNKACIFGEYPLVLVQSKESAEYILSEMDNIPSVISGKSIFSILDGNLIEPLIKAGVNVNVNIEPFEPLIHYAICYQVDLVKTLLAVDGINIHVKNKKGEDVLSYALSRPNLDEDIFSQIFALKPNLKQRNPQGIPLISTMAAECSGVLVKQAIEQGADITALDMLQNTPLMYACLANNLEVVKLLLECDLDINRKNKAGLNALTFALYQGNNELLELLVAANVKPDLPMNINDPVEFCRQLNLSTPLPAINYQPEDKAYKIIEKPGFFAAFLNKFKSRERVI